MKTAAAFSPLQIALGVSVAVHAALLTVRFVNPEAFNRVFQDTPLEVVLVNARSEDKPDKAQALGVVREALAPSLAQPAHAAPAWTTIGRMELALDRLPAALNAAQRGHAAEAASPYPALLALELMERGQTDAESVVKAHLQAAPRSASGAPNVSLAYARILLDLQRNADARTQLALLTTQQPELPEPWLRALAGYTPEPFRNLG